MTFHIDWTAVVGLVTLLGGIAAVIHWLTRSALRSLEDNIESLRQLHVAEATAIKAGVKLLFEKYDVLNSDVQHYKIHVAETYVNQVALEKLLLPIERRLENIETDLRGKR